MAPIALLPRTLEGVKFNGEIRWCEGVPDPADLEGTGFYVPQYIGSTQTVDMLGRMADLEVVQLLTAGYEYVLPFMPPGVLLCNAAGVHDASTAELALGLIIASLRGLDTAARDMGAGRWRHLTRPSLADKNVIVVGAGGVGRAIERRLEPFEVSTIMVGRTGRAGVRSIEELPRLLGDADIIILAVPLNASTKGLVDKEFLSRMKSGALLINVARGPIVVTEDLVVELNEGRISAALDVTDPEPLPVDHALWRCPNLLISPHVGGNSSAFLPRARLLIEAQLGRWAAGEPLANVC